MATKPKEGAQLKSNSRSAPTTPSSSSQKKRIGPTITLYKDTTASMQEKPIPNYLRPTISSGQNSKHQHSESPSKSPIIKKPVEKAASPSSQSKDKARSLKCPLPKPSNSPSWEKAPSPKTVKTAKALTVTPTPTSSKSSISKGTGSASATKRKETKATPQEGERVLSGEEHKAESSPRRDNAEKKEEESYGIEEKLEEIEITLAANLSNGEGLGRKVEGANVALKKEEEAKEKGLPTASKLAGEKRNKVRASRAPRREEEEDETVSSQKRRNPRRVKKVNKRNNCRLGRTEHRRWCHNEGQAEKDNVELVEQQIEEQEDN